VDGFKQRIIGAVVLICLAIIFVPMLFDKPHRKSDTQTIEIPSEPQSQSITIEKPQSPGLSSASQESATSAPMESVPSGTSAPSSSDQVTSAPSKTVESTPSVQEESTPASVQPEKSPAPASKEAPVTETPAKSESRATETAAVKPQGKWIVQLGSFGEESNARRLSEKVRSKGYASYLETAHAGGRTLHRVFAGPFAQKTDAVSAKSTLDRALGVKSLVMAKDQ
jgi:DedD protein